MRSNSESVRQCTGLPRRPKELLAMTKKLGIDCDCRYERCEAIQKEGNFMANEIVIYTDGGCSGNPGPGGWGIVVIADGVAKQLSGGENPTTNNRMELMAAINALSVIKKTPGFSERPVIVNIDSQYVKNGITTWIKSWKVKGWKTADKKPVKNQDLWIVLDELNNSLNVSWNWVKGHAGVEYNEVCDQLCQKEIKKFL